LATWIGGSAETPGNFQRAEIYSVMDRASLSRVSEAFTRSDL
jgi:hypothetical protein